jgi:subtilase family serine protease
VPDYLQPLAHINHLYFIFSTRCMKNNYFKNWGSILRAFLLLTSVLCSQMVAAQSHLLPTSGLTSITTCTGTLYDNGGATGAYAANANGGTTLIPATAGNKIRLQFNLFDVDPYNDVVRIYDGSSTAATLIGEFTNYNVPATIYATNAAGSLTVVLQSDNYYSSNGFAAAVSCVATVPLADLAVQGASVMPLSTVVGNSLSVNCSIYNLGGNTAYTSSVGYYLSTDAMLDANDQLLDFAIGGALTVGYSNYRYGTLTMPATTVPGSYYILFVGDYLNQVAENNELNNIASVNITVVPPSIDLTIQQATVSPLNTAVGTPVTMSCYIANTGNASANSSSVGYYISTDATLDASDQLMTTQYGGPLGTSYPSSRYGTAAIPPGLAPGTYYVLFVADYQNQVSESDETNNVAAVSITVSPPGVDLVIQQEQLYNSYTAAGGTVQTTSSIVNQGNVTSSSSNMGFYLSTDQTLDAADVLLTTAPGGQLYANDYLYRYVSVTVPVGTAAGNYYVLFVADPQNSVTETIETNNVSSQPLTVIAPTVDLYVSGAYASPTSVGAGATINVSCYLENQGNAPANPADLGYYLSSDNVFSANDIAVGSLAGGSLAGGGYMSRYSSVTIPTATAPGNYYLLFVADPQNVLTETLETNNVASAVIQIIAPGIDLQLSSAYASPYTLSSGSPLSLSVTIYNTGTLTAGSSTTGYYLSNNQTLDASDMLLTTLPGVQLGAGMTNYLNASATIPAATAPGYYYVLFVADPQNTVAETNETNNMIAQSIQVVTPSVDLQLSQVYVNGNGVTPGISTVVGAYIYNAGNTTANSSDVTYYLSTNMVLDASDITLSTTAGTALYGGQYMTASGSIIVPTTTPAGNYYLLAKVDPQNSVTETNENNNVSYIQITVLAPFTGTVVPYSGTATITTCNTTVYDHAGYGNYSDSANGMLVINPGNATGKVQLTFNSFQVEQCCDRLYVYDGVNTQAPLLASLSYMPTQPLVATNATGALTLVFMTDGSVTASGFEAVASCVGTSAGPDLLVSQVGASIGQVPAGNSFNVTTVLANPGTLPASNVDLAYYLSTNQTLDSSDLLLGTNAGTTTLVSAQSETRATTLSIPAATALGSYYLLAVADYQNAIAESDETNNVTAQALTVTLGTATREQTSGYVVKAYPNPVANNGTLQLQLNGAGTAQQGTLVLLNSLGQEVRKLAVALRPGDDNRLTIAHDGLASGLYTLRLTGNQLNVVRTVVFE